MECTQVVAYLRVSTEKQAERGLSLDIQRQKVRQFAELYDIKIMDVIEDSGISASTLNRPGLDQALRSLGGLADGLLVVKLDRLTRSVKDLGYLIDEYFTRYTLMSVSERIDTRTPGGKLTLNVLTAVSQWEREVIGERTSAAMQRKMELGEYIGGGVPYGYEVRGESLVELEPEWRVIRAVWRASDEGWSLRKISRFLENRGHLSRTGKRFYPQQIKRILEMRN